MHTKISGSATSLDYLRTLAFTTLTSLSSITCAAAVVAPSIAKYQIVEIPLSGDATANGMNDDGDVVGAVAAGEGPEQAFFYDSRSGAVNYLNFDSGPTTALTISNNGLIGGAAFPEGTAVLWSTVGGIEALPSIGFSFATAVNNNGFVVGYWGFFGPPGGGALTWSGPQHTLAELPQLLCVFCDRSPAAAMAVNDRGYIVGWSTYATAPNSANPASGVHAVEWHDGQLADLGDLGGLSGSHYSVANGINNQNEIIGESEVASGSNHAFLYRRGKMTDIGTLQESDLGSSAASINDRGDIVGSSWDVASTRAFIYSDNHMYDLNTLIDPASPLAGFVHLEAAVAINSRGWIAVDGTDSRDGLQHAYLLMRR